MDNKEKLRVILTHWIEHNSGHVAEFDKWQSLLEEEGSSEFTESFEEEKKRMDKVSEILAEILVKAGGPVKEEKHHKHHHHH